MLNSTTHSLIVLAVATVVGSMPTSVNNELVESVAVIRSRTTIPLCQNCYSDFAELGSGGTINVHKFTGSNAFAQHTVEPTFENALRDSRHVGGPSDVSLEILESNFMSGDESKWECDDAHYSCHGDFIQGYCSDHNACKTETGTSLHAAQGAGQLTDLRAVVAVLKSNNKLRLSDDSKFIRVTDCTSRVVADIALNPAVSAELGRIQSQ